MPNFWGSMPFGSIRILESDSVARGYQTLLRGDRVVWCGKLGAPIEDAEFDGVVLNSVDFLKLKEATDNFKA
jgi:hypothetical protein